jgi:hypothetical protein
MTRWFIVFSIAAMAPVSSFSASVSVPDGPIGEAWFNGYVDTVAPGLENLLGFSFEVKVDYYLSSWDGVSLSYVSDTSFSSNCQYTPTNCVVAASGPVSPDSIGFSVQNHGLVSIFDVNGASGVTWNTSDNRWSGYWSKFGATNVFRGALFGPVTSGGVLSMSGRPLTSVPGAPEPGTWMTLLAGLSALGSKSKRWKRAVAIAVEVTWPLMSSRSASKSLSSNANGRRP